MGMLDKLLKPLVGEKPKVPGVKPVSASQVQAETIAGNQASLPAAQSLATGINDFNVAQRLNILTKALEFAGGPGALNQARSNISSQLRGDIPADIAQQIQRNSAAGSLAGGFGGGSMLGRNLTARDFGLTSLNLMQQGLGNLQSFGSMADTPAWDYTSMFFSPQQRLQHSVAERDTMFNRDWLASQVKAAPSPMGQFIQNVVYAVAGTAGRYFGVAGGGGTGGVGAASAGGGAGNSGSYIPTGGFGANTRSNFA